MDLLNDNALQKRQALLKASGALAKSRGFAASGIDALMKAAGLTSGAFYHHFRSKPDLLKALITEELNQVSQSWQQSELSDQQWLEQLIRIYLSASHAEHPENGCLLPALTAEIGRADQLTRQLFQQHCAELHDVLASRLHQPELAWAFIGQLLGSLQLARSMPDPASRRAILTSGQQLLLQCFCQRTSHNE